MGGGGLSRVFANHSPFPPLVEGTWCEILLTRIISDMADSHLVRLIPMMMGRMIISLKEVANEQRSHPSVDIPSRFPTDVQESYFPRVGDGIPLSQFKSGRV